MRGGDHMLHFGFSYIGALYLLMLFTPNLLWCRRKPTGYEACAEKERRALQLLERIGEVLVCTCVLVFSDFNLRRTRWSVWLAASFALMLLYELYWVRYFRSKRTMQDFYSSFAGVPVAGATLPVCAFFLLGIYGCNAFLLISTFLLGVGHIGIHLGHWRELGGARKKRTLPVRIVMWTVAVLLAILACAAVFAVSRRNLQFILQQK